jgi:hypothetical protein
MKLHFFLIFSLIFVGSCKKYKNHPVPSIPFNIPININLPSYNDLQGVGGYAFVNGGSKGIIVYRRSFEEFVAFDRHSPADGGFDCPTPLTPNPENFLELDDPCSGAKFSLFDGSPIKGSDLGLRAYQVVWDGAEIVRIMN